MWSANMGPTKGSKRTFIVKAKGKPFNLEAFLAYGNGGTRISKHKKGETIFAIPAMVCFTSEKAVARSP